MATVTRGTKAVGGGTNFSGGAILASEVNTDFNNILTDYNGNIDNSNLAAGAAIETSKIDGYSDSATERTTETSPGTTGAESDATTLAGELERLRYKLKQIGTGSSTKRLTGAASELVSWIDLPQTGPNLIRNGNFAVKTTAAGSAPDGWTLVGSPTTCDLTSAGVTEGHSTSKALRIVARASNADGIQQTLAGLKASTKYVIGCRVRVNTAGHHARLVTTGAAAGTFDDLDLAQTGSTDFVTLAGVILTDGTPTNIVVQLLANADATADSFDTTHVWVRECGTDRIAQSNTPWAYNEVTAVTANLYQLNTLTDSTLTVSVTPPGPGYVIEVRAKLALADVAGGTFIGELRENGTGVETATATVAANGYATARFDYVKRDPTPGTTYTYTIYGAGITSAIGQNHAATAAGESPISTWIRCRAVLESGGW